MGRALAGYLGTLLYLGVLWLPVSVSAAITFSDVSSQARFNGNHTSYGASWGDVNGDGWPDIFTNNHTLQNSIYVNQQNGSFVESSAQLDAGDFWTAGTRWEDTHGATWMDFDNDGDQDLLVTTGVCCAPQFMANENGKLYNRTSQLGFNADSDKEGRMPLWFDMDDDGLLEVAMMTSYRVPLYKQSGGVFVDALPGSGFLCQNDSFGTLVDINGDGRLDVLCVRDGGDFAPEVYDTSTIPFGKVEDLVPPVYGVNDVILGDFDGNQRTDMFLPQGLYQPKEVLASGNVVEAHLVNQGSASFSFKSNGVLSVDLFSNKIWSSVYGQQDFGNIFIGSGNHHPNSLSFTLNPADSDVWGYPDCTGDFVRICIGYDQNTQVWSFQWEAGNTWVDSYFYIESTANVSQLATKGVSGWGNNPRQPALLANYVSGLVDTTAASGLNEDMPCVSGVAADFDNDMDEDLYLVCGGGAQNLVNRLYENDGNGNFQRVPNAGGAAGITGLSVKDGAGVGESVVSADYDIDGRMDVFVTNGRNFKPKGGNYGGPNELFRNTSDPRHWIEIDLVGISSNRDGVGAIVHATAGGVTQMRAQNGGIHRWSQNHQRIHFGLADNTEADVRVVWPNGSEDTYLAVAADGLWRLTQGGAKTLLVDRSPGSNDTDGDGLTDAEEAALGTNPNVPDTDGGGVNDGDEVAFGTDPLNPADDVNIPADACGEPAFSGADDQGTFLWLDCDGSNRWHLRVTGGGTTTGLAYQGSIQSQGGVANLIGFSLEASDVLDTTTDPNELAYILNVYNAGVDGFDFTPSVDACFTPIAPDLPVYLGVNRVPAVSSTLTLPGLQPCVGALDTDGDGLTDAEEAALGTNPNVPDTDGGGVNDGDEVAFGTDPLNPADDVSIPADACGEPAFSGADDQGTFLWLDCDGSNRWHLRVTGGGTTTGLAYQGSILSQGGVADLIGFSLEASDVLDTTTDPNELAYILNVYNAGVDGFDFTPSVDACFTPIAPGLPVYLGVNRVLAASSALNLTDLLACAGALDTDGDGLTDAEEVALGTNPNVPDTDGGGVNDGAEVNNGTDPLDPADDGNFVISVCGEPAFSNSVDRATFIWKDCDGSNQWHIRVTGGGTSSSLVYEGIVASPGGLVSLTEVSIETNGTDVLDTTTNPNELSYQLTIWNNGLDGIDFVPTAGGCYTPVGPALPVYVGAARAALGTANLDLDLETASACN